MPPLSLAKARELSISGRAPAGGVFARLAAESGEDVATERNIARARMTACEIETARAAEIAEAREAQSAFVAWCTATA